MVDNELKRYKALYEYWMKVATENSDKINDLNEKLIADEAEKYALVDHDDSEYMLETCAFKAGAARMVEIKDAEIQKRDEMIAKLENALQKYANPQNWRYWSNNDVGALDAWLDFKLGHYSKTQADLGIYLAKEALADLKKWRDEK